MTDERQFAISLAHLDALRKNLPASIDELRVNDFHSIIRGLEEGCGRDLSSFHIPDKEVKAKLVRARRASFTGRPGCREYSAKKYCNRELFSRQVDGLWGYLHPQQDAGPKPESIVHHTSNVVHVDRMEGGSAIQQGIQSSQMSLDFRSREQDIKNLIAEISNQSECLGLSNEADEELRVDIGTINIQFSSGNPKPSIIVECLRSVRTILENAAGAVLASSFLARLATFGI
jgi:hypothetical protein